MYNRAEYRIKSLAGGPKSCNTDLEVRVFDAGVGKTMQKQWTSYL